MRQESLSTRRASSPRETDRCGGFSLVEAVLSVLVVGVMVVAAMNTVGTSQGTQHFNAQKDLAMLLAQDMVAEVVQKAYEEPDQAVVFGQEAGESAGGRDLWDDVDDYDKLANTPPQYADGTIIPWATGYTRAVDVSWLDPDDLTTVSPSERGVKGIRVQIRRGERVLVTLWAMRTNAWPQSLTP